jgi:hypothetical protein
MRKTAGLAPGPALLQPLLAASKEDALKDVKEWDLYLALTQFRTAATLYLLFDLESILKRLSLLFQSTELTPSSI